MEKMIKLVVVDFDDTLSMTEEATFHIENAVAQDMGFPPMTRETHRKNWGKRLDEAIVERIPGIDVDEFLKRLEPIHMEEAAKGLVDKIDDDIIQAFDDVLLSGRKLALLTSRSLREAQHLLRETHPLSKRIERFYHKDNSEFIKPDPRSFDKILKDFCVLPHEAVYIGDAPGDAISSKNAGLYFIATLESGIRTQEDFEGYNVDYFSTTFVEAINLILSDMLI